MALNLKKLAKTSNDRSAPQDHERRSAVPRVPEFDPTYGRGRLPPPKGSSWGDYEEWACEGAWPTPDDKRLAIAGWMGRLEQNEHEEEAAPRL
jgi:hypothetical protein